MIPATVPPFPFYIINKDIIKGSFPFRKTFHTPKPDFTTRFQPPRVFRRPECSADLKSRNRTTETERTGGEGNFPVRRTRQFKDYSIFAPEDFKTRFQTSPSGSSESPLLSPLRHRYCQVNPPTERLNNTHGNICNQVTSVDEFRCFSAFCA